MQDPIFSGALREYVGAQNGLPPDYAERVYSGVLGKLIGVYLGRPVENWTYDRIMAEVGDIEYYIHEKRGRTLVITDDDISGTFTFLRAFEDYGFSPDFTPEQIGNTWLNYLIERATILWWGGMGNSTEHTAYLRLKRGVPASQSGSAAMNGKVISEQIGAQIFIDGWGLIAPGDPEKAIDFARRAASVSHDGEAIYAAQVIAALVSMAFVENRIDALLDTAMGLIPPDSVIHRLITDVREWHAGEPDWRKNRARLEQHYGYDKYLGPVHIVPNHGLIILSLLHGDGDFQKSLSIVNTGGWDTDCNSGNLGTILGVRNGLAGIDDGPDWRGPVADRLYLPTADPGSCITDAVRESYTIINMGRRLAGLEPVTPKGGARFHFEMPGSVQGFQIESTPETSGVASLRNVSGNSQLGERALAISFRKLAQGRAVRVFTPTFMPPESISWTTGYVLVNSPTIYSGQTLLIGLKGDADNNQPVVCRPYLSVYNAEDALDRVYGPERRIRPGEYAEVSWAVPPTNGYPIAEVGVELRSKRSADGVIYLDSVDWSGCPTISLPAVPGSVWGKAWAKAIDRFVPVRDGYSMLSQDEGVGMIIHGTRQWTDYRFSATLNPSLSKSFGICARVQGLRRFYALQICSDGFARLMKHWDSISVLATAPIEFKLNHAYPLRLEVTGGHVRGYVDGVRLFDLEDSDPRLACGGIAIMSEEGCIAANDIVVEPVEGGPV